jgi:CheY-like chemotaxis protein
MRKARILIVENSTIALQIMKRYLKGEEATLVTAATAEEALSAARKTPPDLVFLAFALHGMDGADCCRVLKTDPELAGVPIVMISNTTEETELCRAAGCDAVITRPVARKEFLETGRALLTWRMLREERIPCRATAAWLWNGATCYGTIEDISPNGMFIGTDFKAVTGDILSMKFILPWSGAALIETTARVTWLNSDRQRQKNRLPAGFGVFFQELAKDAEEQLTDYLEFIRMRCTSRGFTDPR